MPEPASFDYALIRVVPRVERGEFFNAGVLLFCKTRDYLAAQVLLDRARLAAIAPGLEPAPVEAALAAFVSVSQGGAAAGPLAGLSQAERFHWLVSPRSTVVQVSPVHSGLSEDPRAALEELFEKLVR